MRLKAVIEQQTLGETLMSDRPDLGADAPTPQERIPDAPVPQEEPSRAAEGPIASQLPAWDLLPVHTLLARRKPAKE